MTRGARRVAAAAGILVAWGVGLGLLAQREFFQSRGTRLADAALQLYPGATFFAVSQGGRHIGFASTTIDTLPDQIDVVDYFVADLNVAGQDYRASARSTMTLSRALALRNFDVQIDAAGNPIRAVGRTVGDTAVRYVLGAPGASVDTQTVRVQGPILLPTLVPMAAMLGERPKVGRRFSIPTIDPGSMQQRTARLIVRAESLFTVDDSAAFDTVSRDWKRALRDTVRAWRIETEDGAGFTGWVDAQGRVVQAAQPGGIVLTRMAYELAFENWRIARDRTRGTGARTARGGGADILERSAIGAGAIIGAKRVERLRVVLKNVALGGYTLDGDRQRLVGDTLTIRKEGREALTPSWSLLAPAPDFKTRFATTLQSEPLLQANDLNMVRRAVAIAGNDRDPRVLAEKINRWVYDSLQKVVTFSVPNALEVLRTRKGDCNEHTQLYVALTRALGIPSRAATGLAYVNGKFYYHAWPEVWLGNRWVAVDPTFGQFPADAAHIRFVVGGLAQQTELLRLVGNLRIQVLEVR
ncbi:MAG: transglutaminase-like domain-containing protein [Gemmatimonadaceae bacterium]|nr:transglutaminase-like domain-containing protein [Gemmatimonadaceae bacterium]